MKIIKRKANDIPKEDAHGGSGSRKVYADPSYTVGNNLEALTHGYLPAKATFDWHTHDSIDEVMVVVKGDGIVNDRDGEYGYAAGDVFVFPANIEHKIHNPTDDEHEMIFLRVKV